MSEVATYGISYEQHGDGLASTESPSFHEPLSPALASPAVAASLRLVTAENLSQQDPRKDEEDDDGDQSIPEPPYDFATHTSEVIPFPPRKDPPPGKKEEPERKAA